MVKDDGISIAGTTWVTGFIATGGNSFKRDGVFFNEIGMENTKEEATMIDLSKAEIGDEFVCDRDFKGDVVMSVVFVDKSKTCFVLRGDGGGDMFVHENGKGIVSGRQGVVSKHEPRWWLKKLPDADLFNADIESIKYEMDSEKGNWYVAAGSGDHWCSFKMPTLTGDEWKQSKISIDELREWQKANG